MPLDLDPSIIGKEFDRTVTGPVTAEELIAFAAALGETRPEYTQAGPDLVGHPTFCLRHKGDRFYPEHLPKTIDLRRGFDAGKDIALGVPVRPGDTIEVRSTLHEVYEKTGRTGSMYFVVIRFTMTNQRGETVAVVDNRFMHR
ncbi:MAG TPA: MaoC family dehydratase N-terminal domain-containing protein [Candidatus Binatia bacterium]|nr:MaoC family dehydratase N-terminal domain-containing protein [Candidatus Binatia bacterium]